MATTHPIIPAFPAPPVETAAGLVVEELVTVALILVLSAVSELPLVEAVEVVEVVEMAEVVVVAREARAAVMRSKILFVKLSMLSI